MSLQRMPGTHVSRTSLRSLGSAVLAVIILTACGGDNASTPQAIQLTTLGAQISTSGLFPQLLAADASTLVYEKNDGNVYRYSAGSELALSAASTPFIAYSWFISSGYIVEAVAPADAGLEFTVWAPDGSSSKFNPPINSQGPGPLPLRVRWPWVLYVDRTQFTSTLFNFATGQAYEISQAGSLAEDFLSDSGQISLYFLGTGNLFRWDQQTALSVPLAPTAGVARSLQADGTLVAWGDEGSQLATDQYSYTLHAMQTTQSSPVALSSAMTDFANADGILAWQEGSVAGGAIKVFDGQLTTTLSSAASKLYGTAAGYVLFAANNQLIAQNSAASRLVFDGQPGQALISGNIVYYTAGSDNVVYRVALD